MKTDLRNGNDWDHGPKFETQGKRDQLSPSIWKTYAIWADRIRQRLGTARDEPKKVSTWNKVKLLFKTWLIKLLTPEIHHFPFHLLRVAEARNYQIWSLIFFSKGHKGTEFFLKLETFTFSQDWISFFFETQSFRWTWFEAWLITCGHRSIKYFMLRVHFCYIPTPAGIE